MRTSRTPLLVLSSLITSTLVLGLLAVASTHPSGPAPAVAQAVVAPSPEATPDALLDRLALTTARASRSRPTPVPKPSVAVRHVRPVRPVHRHHVRPTPRPIQVPTSALKAYAYRLVGPVQFGCLEPLWEHESGWSVTNSYGSAYGIPQALPGSKMASAGADWRTNGRTQIRWGVGYIRARYGTACSAWSHYQRHSWY